MTIICGTDLSHASNGAMAVARSLAALRGEDEVVVVHVVDSDAEGEVEHLRAALEDVIARAGEGPKLRPELVSGPPETALTSYAEAEGSELIVIAASSSDKTSTLGSTAAKIIAITRTPVLVLRDPAPWLAFCAKTRPLKVLAAVDDSIASDLGLQWTHGLRRQGPVEVVVGAVYYPDDAAEHYGVH
ncbi:MAG TPA: universal stress protein, partial [Kofleriaceae bacterium]